MQTIDMHRWLNDNDTSAGLDVRYLLTTFLKLPRFDTDLIGSI